MRGSVSQHKIHKTTEIIKLLPLTLTFEPLLGEPPQQSTTVFTESGTFVVVDFKPVGHVDLETLLVDLQHTHHIIELIMGHKQTKPRAAVVEALPVSKQWVAGLSFLLGTTT